MTTEELIEFLLMCDPKAEVLLAGGDTYCIIEFQRITDTMVWSGAPILTFLPKRKQ
jgi:hypothetical protein